MDIGTIPRNMEDEDDGAAYDEYTHRPRQLPQDLPMSLDDRRPVRSYVGETEMYDAWQGML
jgi:hypothetical protein